VWGAPRLHGPPASSDPLGRMRPHRIAGLLLVVVAIAAAPFAHYATVGWGFLALALGLVGIALLFLTPTSRAWRSESGTRNQHNDSFRSESNDGASDSPGAGDHSQGGSGDSGGGGGDGGS
jgi:uncharacterized membrane protein YgcG